MCCELVLVEVGWFFVYGSYDKDKLLVDKIGLLIEVVMVFGMGYYGMIFGCLCVVDCIVDVGFVVGKMVDIGCGIVVLVMVVKKIWLDSFVFVLDIDCVVVDVVEVNLIVNNMGGEIICVELVGFDVDVVCEYVFYDLIFVNILKGLLIVLLLDMVVNLCFGGCVILFGLLNE